MYDKFRIELDSLQILVGIDDKQMLARASTLDHSDDMFLIPRSSVQLKLEVCILPTAYTLAKTRITGTLPDLQLNFSDEKYRFLRQLLRNITQSLPGSSSTVSTEQLASPFGSDVATKAMYDALSLSTSLASPKTTPVVTPEMTSAPEDLAKTRKQVLIHLDFAIQRLCIRLSRASETFVDGVLKHDLLAQGNIESLDLKMYIRSCDLELEAAIGRISIRDEMETFGEQFRYLLSSHDVSGTSLSAVDKKYSDEKQESKQKDRETVHGSLTGLGCEGQPLVNVKFWKADRISPEFSEKFQGIDVGLSVAFGMVFVGLNRTSLLQLYQFCLDTFVERQ